MILTHLPAPTRDYTRPEPPPQAASTSQALVSPGSLIPPYGSAERLHFRPRKLSDYGDGGEPAAWLAPTGRLHSVAGLHTQPSWLRRALAGLPHRSAGCRASRACAAGAFPEIQVPQYPCDMGKKDAAKSSSTLATTLNAQGGINYDSILRQGKNRDKLIASDHSAMVPKVDKVAGGVRHSLAACQQLSCKLRPLTIPQPACTRQQCRAAQSARSVTPQTG